MSINLSTLYEYVIKIEEQLVWHYREEFDQGRDVDRKMLEFDRKKTY